MGPWEGFQNHVKQQAFPFKKITSFTVKEGAKAKMGANPSTFLGSVARI